MSQTATAPAKTPFAYTGEVTISVNVKDMNRAIDWYGQAFGFELIYKLDEWGWCELSTPLCDHRLRCWAGALGPALR